MKFLLSLIFLPLLGLGQNKSIVVINETGQYVPKAYIINSSEKTIGITDSSGSFRFETQEGLFKIKRLGYYDKSISLDTISNDSKILLIPKILNEVEIKSNKINKLENTGVDLISLEELGKLACCNVAESFENSNTIDVSYADGVTGTREIKMLGLAGVYSQQLMEATPYFRGINAKVGLELIPGPWLTSISVNKGIGSVINGYENITGQINMNFFNPKTSLDWQLNGYINDATKSDFNIIKGFKISRKVYTNFFAHTSFSLREYDNNGDGFMDMPVFTNFNLMNKWQYFADNGFVINAAIQATNYKSRTGQMTRENTTYKLYNVNTDDQVYNLMFKAGWLLDAVKESSFAIKLRSNISLQNGMRDNGIIKNHEYYVNLSPIYVSNLGKLWKMAVGGQILFDQVGEQVDTLNFYKNEWVEGAFGEFTFQNDQWMVIMGLRGDYHNTLGFFASPRTTIQFNPNSHHILKASGGLGFRTPALLTESFNYLISNRRVVLPQELQAEKAINLGASYKYNFNIGKTKGSYFEIGYYTTIFQNQLIYNVETPEELRVSYLQNNSSAQSFQIETGLEFNQNWDLKLAYRWDNNKILFDSIQKVMPLLKRDKFLANLSWKSNRDHWRVSTTFLVNGPSRVPQTYLSPEVYSPFYFTMHAQVNYLPTPMVNIYIGSENITNYVQEERIVEYQNPLSPGFDAAMIWGPLDMRRIYVGLKLQLHGLSKAKRENLSKK